MTEEQKKAIGQVCEELRTMNAQEFRNVLDSHKTGEWANLIAGAIQPKHVVENWHDDLDLVGQRVVEYLGESYDKRNLALYRLSDGWLGWLPKSCVRFVYHATTEGTYSINCLTCNKQFFQKLKDLDPVPTICEGCRNG